MISVLAKTLNLTDDMISRQASAELARELAGFLGCEHEFEYSKAPGESGDALRISMAEAKKKLKTVGFYKERGADTLRTKTKLVIGPDRARRMYVALTWMHGGASSCRVSSILDSSVKQPSPSLTRKELADPGLRQRLIDEGYG